MGASLMAYWCWYNSHEEQANKVHFLRLLIASLLRSWQNDLLLDGI